MGAGEVSNIFYEMFVMVLQLGGPILLASMLVGVIVSILQAATQINEQTLTFVPKLLVIAIVLALMGDMILVRLQEFTITILDLIVTG